jgi:short-subunit dehydrogenase
MQKSILITGCSTGIGLCAAQTLKKKGYRVFATARKFADTEKLTALGLESTVLDINDSHSIHAAFNYVMEKTGGTLDAVFNNAGFAIPGAVEDLTRETLREQFETNVFGTIELTNLIIPIMRKQGYGRIIQNTSILGVVAMPYRGNYNASKFALEGFTHTLRQELRHTNIHVSIIAPGPIATRFRDNASKNYQAKFSGIHSPHQAAYDKMEKEMRSSSAAETVFTSSPNAVVKKLLHALESSRPRARYYIGFAAKALAFLHRILPDSALDRVIQLF